MLADVSVLRRGRVPSFLLLCVAWMAGPLVAEADWAQSGAAALAGDVNGNGVVDVQDRSLLINHLLGRITLREDQRAGADANGDGTIDMADALKIEMIFEEPLPTTTVTGRVELEDGTPLASAKVMTSEGGETTAGLDGSFSMEVAIGLGPTHPNPVMRVFARLVSGGVDLRGSVGGIIPQLGGETEAGVIKLKKYERLTFYGSSGGRAFVGPAPRIMLTADFNDDGIPDVATANTGEDSALNGSFVSVILGKADGSFQQHQEFWTAQTPVDMDAADFNNDGHLDIAVIGNPSGQVSILLGDGNGAFGLQRKIDMGQVPTSMATADFNGDGKIDIAVTNAGDGVSVLFGDGKGSFPTKRIFLIGDTPISIGAADFNGDGIEDIVTANSGNKDLSLLFGLGDGTFRAQEKLILEKGPGGRLFGPTFAEDINSDGKADIVTVDPERGDVAVLLSHGNGTFAPLLISHMADETKRTAFADFDRNGTLDLITIAGSNISKGGIRISISPGNGDGTFGEHQEFRADTNPTGLAVADFDGDGHLDVATSHIDFIRHFHDPGFVMYLRGKGDGSFEVPSRTSLPIASLPGHQQSVPTLEKIVDLNGDGFQDILLISDHGLVTLYLGNGDGTLGPIQEIEVGRGSRSLHLLDLNGDGILDIFTPSSLAGSVSVLFGNGDGSFQTQKQHLVGNRADSAVKADFNGDGFIDFVIASEVEGENLAILLGNGNGSFLDPIEVPVAGLKSFSFVEVADFNADGVADLLTLNTEEVSSILLGKGDGTFELRETVSALPASSKVADFNNDNFPDLVWIVETMALIRLGNGDGTFQPAQSFEMGHVSRIVIADFNRDDNLDISGFGFAGYAGDDTRDSNVFVILGNGDGSFEAPTMFAVGKGPLDLVVVDLDGDGILDQITPNNILPGPRDPRESFVPTDISVIMGKGDGTFQVKQSFALPDRPRQLMAGDFNGDGRLDLVVRTESGSSITILLQRK